MAHRLLTCGHSHQPWGSKLSNLKPPKITIKSIEVGQDPSITIYEVELQSESGIWRETYGTRELVEAFLRGVKAAYGINQELITTPDLPRSVT